MKLSLKKRAYNATAGWGLQDYAIHQAARAWVAGYRAAKRDARKKRPASSASECRHDYVSLIGGIRCTKCGEQIAARDVSTVGEQPK